MTEADHHQIRSGKAMTKMNHVHGRGLPAHYPAGYVACSARPGIWQCTTINCSGTTMMISDWDVYAVELDEHDNTMDYYLDS